MFALQIAAHDITVGTDACFLPNRALHCAVQLRKRKRLSVAALTSAALTGAAPAVFDDAARDDRAHQPVQHITLHGQHALGQIQLVRRPGRDVIAEKKRIALEPLGDQLAPKLRGHLEAVAAQQALGNQRQCFALLGGIDRGHRQTRGSRVVVHQLRAADVLGGRAHRVAHLRKARQKAAPQHRIAFAAGQGSLLQALPQFLRQLHTALEKRKRVAAEIALVDQRIDCNPDVLVGRKRQLRFVGARGDLGQLCAFLLRGKWLVRILERPIVVRAERWGEVRTLRLAFQRDIDRRVLHHRTGQPVLIGIRLVGDLLQVDRGRRPKVVAQTERVTDLVHRDVLEKIEYQLVGLRTIWVELAARFEQRQCKAHFARGVFEVVAKAAVNVAIGADRGRVQLTGHCVIHRRVRHDAFGSQGANVAHHVGVPTNVGIQNLAGARIDLRRADRAE